MQRPIFPGRGLVAVQQPGAQFFGILCCCLPVFLRCPAGLLLKAEVPSPPGQKPHLLQECAVFQRLQPDVLLRPQLFQLPFQLFQLAQHGTEVGVVDGSPEHLHIRLPLHGYLYILAQSAGEKAKAAVPVVGPVDGPVHLSGEVLPGREGSRAAGGLPGRGENSLSGEDFREGFSLSGRGGFALPGRGFPGWGGFPLPGEDFLKGGQLLSGIPGDIPG